MRRAFAAAALALLAGCTWGRQAAVSGTVVVAPSLLARLQHPNTVLLVVARDPGGIPVALREIINPRFPCPFRIEAEDLILPDAWDGPLTLTAQFLTRAGDEALPTPDLEVAYPGAVRAGDPPVRLFVTAPRPSWSSAQKPRERTVITR